MEITIKFLCHYNKKLFLFFKEELPYPYDAWISIAKNLPVLIENGELRTKVEKVWISIVFVFYYNFLTFLIWFWSYNVTHTDLSQPL